MARLFNKHKGANPLQVARTIRPQKAKRMPDDSELNISSIAFKAGMEVSGNSTIPSAKSISIRHPNTVKSFAVAIKSTNKKRVQSDLALLAARYNLRVWFGRQSPLKFQF